MYAWFIFSSCSCFYVLSKTSSDPGKLKLQQIKLNNNELLHQQVSQNNRFKDKH